MRLRGAFLVISFALAGHLATFSQTTYSNVVVIDSAKFTVAATGINRFNNAFLALEAGLRPNRIELDNLRKAYVDATTVISGSPAAVYSAKAELAVRLEREIQLKQNEFERIHALRIKMIIEPINQDIRSSLRVWAKQHGIDIIIDLNKARDVVFVINDSIDITRAFITDYNADYKD